MPAGLDAPLNPPIANTCPHLGARRDRDVYYSFPSNGNRCYRGGPSDVPTDAHQSAYCLTNAFAGCPVYRGDDGAAFPPDLRAFDASRWSPRLRGLPWIALILGLGLLAELGLYLAPRLQTGSRAPATIPAATAPILPSTETTLPPTQPAPTLTALPTDTALPQAHALEAPINVGDREFRIHRVQWGDTFESLAATYATTADVIRLLNYNLVPPLRSDSLIVLAPGLLTPDPTLPAFRLHEVTDATTLSALASDLLLDPVTLARFNGCPSDCRLSPGDWLLIPVPR